MTTTDHPNHWAYAEAARLSAATAGKALVTFETGYGPSGAPHIGTLGEVIRTTLVRRAFAEIDGRPSRLIVFSDDLDGLRKLPDSLIEGTPEHTQALTHLDRPLCEVPAQDIVPGTVVDGSFAALNVTLLVMALEDYGFEVVYGGEALARLRAGDATAPNEVLCVTASRCYRSGLFDDTLREIARNAQGVLGVVLGHLGQERQETYCPFMPIHDGRVVQKLGAWHLDGDTLHWVAAEPPFNTPFNAPRTSPITGGGCKLQWKVDWPMRWMALGVDYEMHGKDLMSSADIGQKLVRVLGHTPPTLMRYELFLDELGQKVSKSRGNGVTLEDWQRYSVVPALWHYLALDPTRARKVGLETILLANDGYLAALRTGAPEIGLIHGDEERLAVPAVDTKMLLTTIGMVGATCANHVVMALPEYRPGDPSNPLLTSLIGKILNYYDARIRPSLAFRVPTDSERVMIQDLIRTLDGMPEGATAEEFQTEVYEVGKRHYAQAELRSFFQVLYEVLVGQPSGPRFGHFVAFYGRDAMIAKLRNTLA